MPQFDDSVTNARIDALHSREEERTTQMRASMRGYAYINLFDVAVDTMVLKRIDEDIAREARVALFAQKEKEVSLAVENPDEPHVGIIIQLLEKRGFQVSVYLATLRSITHAWEGYKSLERASVQKHGTLDVEPERIKEYAETITSYLDVSEKVHETLALKDPRQISLLISILFGGALSLGASDIHIEPEAQKTRVRYRLDGVLVNVCDLEAHPSEQIVSRLKLLAGVKLNIKKEAQDGRFTFDIGTREVEVRASVIPGAYGESLVLRLLDPSASSFSIDNLGLNARMYEVLTEELKRPSGALLTTGPTGSGKTTALYSFLLSIHTPDIKIITLEDPIEYKLPGIVQTQITEDYSFENGLRTILRQDPDVILVGEIRDRYVAETAMQAALTGHLVFSTLHTNSAAGAISRLSNLGVGTDVIGSACNIILGQRLVRKLCSACKKEHEITIEEHKIIQRVLECSTTIHQIYSPVGCDQCDGSGYKGRIGIYEAIRMDTAVKEAIRMDTREETIREAAKTQNIPTMQQDAIMKVLAGITSLDEVSRVLDLHSLT